VSPPGERRIEAHAHAPLLAPVDPGEEASHAGLGVAHVGHGAVVAGEEREELHGQRREPPREVLDDARVGGAAQRHPFEVAQAALDRRAAVARQRSVGGHQPQVIGRREQTQRAGAGQAARRPDQ
jgi:hypothetical protein